MLLLANTAFTSIWCVCFGTKFWPGRLSSSEPWRGWLSRQTPDTSAGESVSPAHRSAAVWTTSAASSSWEAFGSGMDDLCDVSQWGVRGTLDQNRPDVTREDRTWQGAKRKEEDGSKQAVECEARRNVRQQQNSGPVITYHSLSASFKQKQFQEIKIV